MKNMILIDGNNMMHRILSCIPQSNDGLEVALSNNFIRSYISFLKKNPDSHAILAFDSGYEKRKLISQLAVDNGILTLTYKQERREKRALINEDIWRVEHDNKQINNLKKLLDYTNIQQVIVPGNEGDDIIASYCAKYKNQFDVVILSNDKDYFQLLDDNVRIYNAIKRMDYNKNDFIREYGIDPKQWVDMGALMGDSGDSIEGCPGFGENKALDYIKNYGDISSLINHFRGIIEPYRNKYPDIKGKKYSGVLDAYESKSEKFNFKKIELNLLIYEERINVSHQLKNMIVDLDIPEPKAKENDRFMLEKMMEDYKMYAQIKDIDMLTTAKPRRIITGIAMVKPLVKCSCGREYISDNKSCPFCSKVESEQLSFDL